MLIDALPRRRARADGAGRPRHAPEPPPAAAALSRMALEVLAAAERRTHASDAVPGPLLIPAGDDFEVRAALTDERPPLVTMHWSPPVLCIGGPPGAGKITVGANVGAPHGLAPGHDSYVERRRSTDRGRERSRVSMDRPPAAATAIRAARSSAARSSSRTSRNSATAPPVIAEGTVIPRPRISIVQHATPDVARAALRGPLTAACTPTRSGSR